MTMRPRLTVLAGIYVFALAACGGEQEQQQPPPPEVGVLPVQPVTVPLQKDLVGRLGAYRSADVRARVPGVLQKRLYEEGSDVREGAPLFEIDPAPYRADLGAAQASLAQARANHANAQAAAERARRLAPENFISRSDLDNALAAERSSRAAVQAAQASVEAAQINLGYATVRAPISGRAGQQQVTEGALVGQGTATLLATVDQVDPLYVNFSMSVSELDRVRRMQLDRSGPVEVQIILQDGSVYEHTGELDFSGDVVDPATGAVSLRAVLPNPNQTLRPGAYVTLQVTLGQQPGMYLVPQAAVQRDASGAYVMVVGEGDTVARRQVVTERAQDGHWIVSDGLAAGDRVIVSGLQKAQPEAPVRPVPWQPAAAGQVSGADARAQNGGGADAPAHPDATAAPQAGTQDAQAEPAPAPEAED